MPMDPEKITALSTIARLAGWSEEHVRELADHLAALDPAPREPHEQLYAALDHGWANKRHLIVSLDWKSAVSELAWQIETLLRQQGVKPREIPLGDFTPPDETAVYEDGCFKHFNAWLRGRGRELQSIDISGDHYLFTVGRVYDRHDWGFAFRDLGIRLLLL